LCIGASDPLAHWVKFTSRSANGLVIDWVWGTYLLRCEICGRCSLAAGSRRRARLRTCGIPWRTRGRPG